MKRQDDSIIFDGNSRTLKNIYYALGERDFKIRLANRMYIVIIEKDSIEINMIMQPMVVGGPIRLIHNPDLYSITLTDKELSIHKFTQEIKYIELFRMNFDSYTLELPSL